MRGALDSGGVLDRASRSPIIAPSRVANEDGDDSAATPRAPVLPRLGDGTPRALRAAVQGAAFVACVDASCLATTVPSARGEVSDHVVLDFVLLAPVSIVLVLVSEGFARYVAPRRARGTALVSAGISIAVTLASAFVVESVYRRLKPEFPVELSALRVAGHIGALVAGALTRLSLTGALAEPLVSSASASPRRRLDAGSALIVSTASIVFAYRVLESVHLGLLGGMTTALALLASSRAFAAIDRRTPRAGSAAFVALGLVGVVAIPLRVGPFGAPGPRYHLFSNSPVAGFVAARIRDALDFDGDGSGPSWALGADCAPFDPARGPLRAEIPGDGIDQDCVFGDGGAAPPLPRPVVDPARLRCSVRTPIDGIVLVSIDALRADAVGRATTPHLESLARNSLRFTRAYAAAGFTYHAMFAMSSGLPVAALRHDLTGAGRARGSHVAPVLGAAGYRTGSFRPVFLPRGLLAGFDVVWPATPPPRYLGHESAPTVEAALSFIGAEPTRRFFAWLHFPDAHAPYEAEGRDAAERYRREVSLADASLGRLLAGLERIGRAEGTAIVVTADHGEALFDRGHQGHGIDAFEETIHVPLVVHIPGCEPATLTEPVSHTRLAPFFRLLAARPPGAPTILDVLPDDVVVSEVFTDELLLAEVRYKRAIVVGDAKLHHDVRNGGMVLFDLARDPGEREDRFDRAAPHTRTVLARYARWLAHRR